MSDMDLPPLDPDLSEVLGEARAECGREVAALIPTALAG